MSSGGGSQKCGAKNRAGKPCQRPAGWGTHHPGEGKCKLHGGASHGAPPGERNGRWKHGLRASYVPIDGEYVRLSKLSEVLPDPAKRMAFLAQMMTDRAVTAHQRTMNEADDSDATDKRIAAAVRTAAQATRVELAATKLRIETPVQPDDEPDTLTDLERARRVAFLLASGAQQAKKGT